MRRHELTDEQWAVIRPLVPERTAKTGRKPSDPRLMLDGVFWVLCTGTPWRDLPERFGPWQTVYDHFASWRKAGVFATVVEALQLKLDKAGLIDWDLWCVDGASVRAARAAAGAESKRSSRQRQPGEPADHALGRSRGGFGSKFHLVTDGKGTPLAVESHGRPGARVDAAGVGGRHVHRLPEAPPAAASRGSWRATRDTARRGSATGSRPAGSSRSSRTRTTRRRGTTRPWRSTRRPTARRAWSSSASAGSRSSAASARGSKSWRSTSTGCSNWR